MKMPTEIYLVQPYPDTADCEWVNDPAAAGVKPDEATKYVRADKVQILIDQVKSCVEDYAPWTGEDARDMARACEGALTAYLKAE